MDLGLGKIQFKWTPHPLTSDSKGKRVEIAKELLQFLESASARSLAPVFTGDETWFYLSNIWKITWIRVDVPPSTRLRQTIGVEK
jgi:hypothetical protein